MVALREDLRSGELPLHLFAPDLYEVLMGSGKHPVCEDPRQFFALTFPTYNLRQLVRDVVLRVAAKNDKAVRQLELTCGGRVVGYREEPAGAGDRLAAQHLLADVHHRLCRGPRVLGERDDHARGEGHAPALILGTCRSEPNDGGGGGSTRKGA